MFKYWAPEWPIYAELLSKGNAEKCIGVNPSPYVQGLYSKIHVSTLCMGLFSDLISQSPNDPEDKMWLDMLIFNGKKNMYNVARKAKTMSQKMVNNSTISKN